MGSGTIEMDKMQVVDLEFVRKPFQSQGQRISDHLFVNCCVSYSFSPSIPPSKPTTLQRQIIPFHSAMYFRTIDLIEHTMVLGLC